LCKDTVIVIESKGGKAKGSGYWVMGAGRSFFAETAQDK